MRPAEVLDHKADLMVRMDDPNVRGTWRGQVLMDLVKANTEREAAELAATIDSDSTVRARFRNGLDADGARGNAAATVEALHYWLPDAECFHVTEDMTHLVTYAASQLDDTDRVNRMMLPTQAGLVRFEGGLPFRDVRNQMMKVSWAAWCPVLAKFGPTGQPHETTLVYLWNDHREEPDDIYRRLVEQEDPDRRAAYERAVGRWGFIGTEYIIDGMRLGSAYAEPDERKRAEVLADGDTPTAFTNTVRLMHALWMLLGQTITQTGDAHLDRAVRKRAGKARIPARVTVIQLRNIESRRAPGESLVEWNHRWIVRGHPAWRACGPEHPLAELYPGATNKYRCRVWIAPFEKGPADKPLIITEKVYSLSR